MSADKSDLPYRPCVGVMLFNGARKIWVGRRIPKWAGDRSAHMWQMPQGGIDRGEAPEQAALRELEEETGTTKAHIIGHSDDWLFYDLPDDLLGRALNGKYRGQKQKWFAMQFEGSDRDIDISGRGAKPEFDRWKWVAIEELPSLVVEFKRDVYRQLVEIFTPLTR